MGLVGRPAIRAYVQAVASRFDHAFVTVVAGLAQGLECTEPELVPVTTMGLHVIHYGGRGDASLPGTAGAQRMIEKLAHAETLPDRQVIPVIPRIPAIVLGHGVTARCYT